MVAYRIMTMACWIVIWLLLKRIRDLEKEVETIQDDIYKLFLEVREHTHSKEESEIKSISNQKGVGDILVSSPHHGWIRWPHKN